MPVLRALFPFLFGGAFIEGSLIERLRSNGQDFPSFSEGLSLRDQKAKEQGRDFQISLPFRRGFH